MQGGHIVTKVVYYVLVMSLSFSNEWNKLNYYLKSYFDLYCGTLSFVVNFILRGWKYSSFLNSHIFQGGGQYFFEKGGFLCKKKLRWKILSFLILVPILSHSLFLTLHFFHLSFCNLRIKFLKWVSKTQSFNLDFYSWSSTCENWKLETHSNTLSPYTLMFVAFECKVSTPNCVQICNGELFLLSNCLISYEILLKLVKWHPKFSSYAFFGQINYKFQKVPK